MLSILSKIFGTEKVIDKGLKILDDIHYSDQERQEDSIKKHEAKVKAKIDYLKAHAPFKVAQRVLAIMFSSVYIFILIFGIFIIAKVDFLGGGLTQNTINSIIDFATNLKLDWIVLAIIGFYFGGGFKESWNRGKK